MPTEPSQQDLSLGEFQAITAKAIRGVGYPWGVVEEGAAACRRLAEWGIDPSASLVRLLSTVDGAVSQYWPNAALSTPSGSLCSLAAGSVVRDLGAVERLELPALLEPLLLSPAMAVLAGTGADYQLAWPGGTIVVAHGGAGIAVDLGDPDTPVTATLTRLTGHSVEPTRRSTRIAAPREALRRLEHFAARTYAPNTEASRTKGAG